MKKLFIILLFSCLSASAFVNDIGFNIIISSIIGIALLFFYKKNISKIKINGWFMFLSILFSLFMTIGNSIKECGSLNYFFDNWLLSSISLIGYIIFFNFILFYLNDLIKNKKIKTVLSNSKLFNLMKKHPFSTTFIFLFICYLPYIIAFYPILLNPDGVYQIQEVMGIPTWYLDSVVLPENHTMITNFHPVLHTLLLGGFFKIGHILGNDNFGLFLYTFFQLSLIISIFSYTISYMYKNKFNKKLIFFSLLAIAIIPAFASYSITATKDVIFSSLILLYIIRIYDFIKKDNPSIKDVIILTVISIFILLFRNNGFLTVMLSLPFLLILKKKIVAILVSILIVVFSYYSYNKLLLPYFNIPNTSIREILSIPFQHIGRLVTYHSDEIEEQDKDVIDKILVYDTISERYKPNIVDPIKNEFNKNYTKEELKDFFKVWYKYLKKEPIIYINATLNTTYGYIYPNTTNWYLYNKIAPGLEENNFDCHFNSLGIVREGLKAIGNIYPHIPIIGLSVNIGFNFWVVFAMTIFYIVNKKKKLILLLLPLFSIFLACIVGPVNTYFRYVLPVIFSMPFIINVIYFELNRYKHDINKSKKMI